MSQPCQHGIEWAFIVESRTAGGAWVPVQIHFAMSVRDVLDELQKSHSAEQLVDMRVRK